MANAISHLEKKLLNIRAGKANPNMLSNVGKPINKWPERWFSAQEAIDLVLKMNLLKHLGIHCMKNRNNRHLFDHRDNHLV